MASFERIFNLAKKTGDRMIIFDSATGEGFAAIPIDEYEEMVTDPRDVRALSGDAFLEQINNDIALWRAHQEAQEREEFADILEEKMADEPPFDPFFEDHTHKPEWHSAGAILQDRYNPPPFDFEEEEDDWEDEDDDDIDFDALFARDRQPLPSFDFEEEQVEDAGSDDLTFEDVPFDPPMPTPVPPATEDMGTDWQEEPLEEDPIFFEEPIE